ITTHYRFLLLTPRQLTELKQMKLALADMYRLERGEAVCAAARWADVLAKPKLLLVTSQGVARPYPVNVLRENIEAPIPLRFDHPLPGVVVAALGVDEKDMLIMITRDRRGVRWPVKSLRLSGTQAINCGADDRVKAAALVKDELALAAADGYGRRLRADWVPIPPKPNQKGKSLIARRGELTAILTESPGWLLSSTGMIGAEYGRLPLEDSTKSQQLLKLKKGETIQCAVSGAGIEK
ncbi:MAG: hypothetical protein GY803_10435, partial [Chloroflexi bacterium]|nr:hypothetical protein [Chloroflexota bacterium]